MERATGRGLHHLLAGLVLAGTVASGWLGWEVRKAEDAGIRRATQEQAEEVVDDLRREIEALVDAVARMGDRWVVAGGTPKASWRADAANYVRDYRGFRAIVLVGPDGRVEGRAPADPDVIGRTVELEPRQVAAMEEARRTGAPALAAPVELFTGGTGAVVLVPLGPGAVDGWILGVFHIGDFLRATKPVVPGYEISAYGPAGALYTSTGSTSAPPSLFCATRPMLTPSDALTIDVCASPAFVAERRGLLPAVTVVTGLAFTVLAAALLRALEAARARTAEARRLAASLRDHAAALEVAQRDVTGLSYSMSHELRTPLRAIDGHAALLAETAPDSVLPSLARIRANAQRMGRQLDGIIELFRVIRRELDVRQVDVTALAKACLENLTAAEPSRQVDARVAEGLVVHGDPELVRIVVVELIANAWRFSASRDRVRIDVGASPQGFFVEDAGVGFDMAYANKLFQVFERLHPPGEFEGLGLGLAIAARAAARHGASLRAEGRPGEGAVFWVDWR